MSVRLSGRHLQVCVLLAFAMATPLSFASPAYAEDGGELTTTLESYGTSALGNTVEADDIEGSVDDDGGYDAESQIVTEDDTVVNDAPESLGNEGAIASVEDEVSQEAPVEDHVPAEQGDFPDTEIEDEAESVVQAEEEPIIGRVWDEVYREVTSLQQFKDAAVVIGLGNGSSLVVDPSGGNVTPGTKLQLWTSNDTVNQRFLFELCEDGTYQIIGIKSGCALTVSADNPSAGTAIVLSSRSDSPMQRWKLLRCDATRFGIVPIVSEGLALSIVSAVRGGAVVLDRIGEVLPQFALYLPQPLIDPCVGSIENETNGNMVLDLSNNSVRNGANIQLYDRNWTPAQRFSFTWNKRVGYYTISLDANPNFVLDVAGGGTTSGTNVQLYQANDTPAQWWVIRSFGGLMGNSIRSAKSGLQLGARNNAIARGSNIAIFTGVDNVLRAWVPPCTNKRINPSDGVGVNSSEPSALWNDIYRSAGYYGGIVTGKAVVISFNGTSFVLDPAGGKTDRGTPLQVWTNNDTANQRFIIHERGDGTYGLEGLKSGLYLEANIKGNRSGTVSLAALSDSINQRWQLIEYGEAIYHLVCADGSGLGIAAGSMSRGASVVLVDVRQCTPLNLYIPQPTAQEQTCTLSSKVDYHFALYFDNKASSTPRGTYRKGETNESQVFRIIWDDHSGYYKIVSEATQRVLDVVNGDVKAGTAVQLYVDNGTLAQRWIIQRISDGMGYDIKYSKSGLQLGSDVNKPQNGSKIIIQAVPSSVQRGWYLTMVGKRSSDNYSSKKLSIPTNWFGGGETNEAYHPKVVAFDEQWNSWKYWMAFTPYPSSNALYENPSICVSNDLLNWVVPQGLTNPVDDTHMYNKSIYNSDTHLLYNTELNRLELFWRRVEYDNWYICRATSIDGISWSDKEVILHDNGVAKTDALSPVVMYDEGKYRMWYVTDRWGTVHYTESEDCKSWSKATQVTFPYRETALRTWHLDIEKTPFGYEAVLSATDSVKDHRRMSVWHSRSNDGISGWSCPTEIIAPTLGTACWDNIGTYRSCLLYVNGMYYIFYSGTSVTGYRHGVGLVRGETIDSLKRVTSFV